MIGEYVQITIMAILAGAGALARVLNQKDRKTENVSRTISACFIAMFSGVLAHFLAAYFGLDTNLSYAIAGISGWAGPSVLDAVTSLLSEKIGVKLEAAENVAVNQANPATADKVAAP